MARQQLQPPWEFEDVCGRAPASGKSPRSEGNHLGKKMGSQYRRLFAKQVFKVEAIQVLRHPHIPSPTKEKHQNDR